MRKLVLYLSYIVLLMNASTSVDAHTAGAVNYSVTYPAGNPCPNQFCEYYYADTHFSFSIYWNPDPIFVNSANIVHTDGTYTYCTGCGTYPVYDQWEQERLWIGTNKNPTSLLYTTVYDSSAHNGHLHTNSNSSLLEDYYPNAKVTLGDNYVIGYFELKNYDKTLPSGPLKEHLFPKRYRQNFN
ncbi:hypothetical protein QFZ81_003012 [Paenibacillus sp. V4I9]|uniref:hypothetical protein n=1 Tax=Paenibacillus sp. V4I9 TaxID=3042308 RepID=UPI0027882752|nr:hypothetical protein [Paenibacillus sp. V4I9]MDQ0887924.1 hypothetical protein [Paenibacillus sp. V4I9]